MSDANNAADENVRAHIAQLLEVSALLLRDDRPGILVQWGRLGEVEPPITLNTWDAFRLAIDVLKALGSLPRPDARIERLLPTVWEIEPPAEDGTEAADPNLGPWPPLPKPTRGRKRRKP